MPSKAKERLAKRRRRIVDIIDGASSSADDDSSSSDDEASYVESDKADDESFRDDGEISAASDDDDDDDVIAIDDGHESDNYGAEAPLSLGSQNSPGHNNDVDMMEGIQTQPDTDNSPPAPRTDTWKAAKEFSQDDLSQPSEMTLKRAAVMRDDNTRDLKQRTRASAKKSAAGEHTECSSTCKGKGGIGGSSKKARLMSKAAAATARGGDSLANIGGSAAIEIPTADELKGAAARLESKMMSTSTSSLGGRKSIGADAAAAVQAATVSAGPIDLSGATAHTARKSTNDMPPADGSAAGTAAANGTSASPPVSSQSSNDGATTKRKKSKLKMKQKCASDVAAAKSSSGVPVAMVSSILNGGSENKKSKKGGRGKENSGNSKDKPSEAAAVKDVADKSKSGAEAAAAAAAATGPPVVAAEEAPPKHARVKRKKKKKKKAASLPDPTPTPAAAAAEEPPKHAPVKRKKKKKKEASTLPAKEASEAAKGSSTEAAKSSTAASAAATSSTDDKKAKKKKAEKRVGAVTTTTATTAAAAKPPPKKKKRTFQDSVYLTMLNSCKPYTLKTLGLATQSTEQQLNYVLLSLVDKDLVRKKEFAIGAKSSGRTKTLYWANQDATSSDFKNAQATMEEMMATRNELARLHGQMRSTSVEMDSVMAEPTNDDLTGKVKAAEAEVEALRKQAAEMKDRIKAADAAAAAATSSKPSLAAGRFNKGVNTPIERDPIKLKKKINGMREEWKKRKEKCMDFVDNLGEAMDKSRKDAVKLLDIETDEAERAKMPPKYVIEK